jgi:hypothetical protein
VPKQFEIEVGPLEYGGGYPPSLPERLLHIEASCRIVVDGREWFNEPMFSVVEFAGAVTTWLQRGGDFEFESMEADESPLLWVRVTGDECIVGAAWEAFSIDEPFPLHVVRGELDRFASSIPAATKAQLDIDVSDLMAEPDRWQR